MTAEQIIGISGAMVVIIGQFVAIIVFFSRLSNKVEKKDGVEPRLFGRFYYTLTLISVIPFLSVGIESFPIRDTQREHPE